jgi:hypothetical protein
MATASGLFPRQLRAEVEVAPVATAGNDLNSVAWVAPAACTVSAVTYTPLAAQTGSATARTYVLVNTGQTGVGTTVVATLALTSGVNTVALDEKAITLSATAANLDVALGDVLEWQSTHVSTGITDPGGLVKIEALTN